MAQVVEHLPSKPEAKFKLQHHQKKREKRKRPRTMADNSMGGKVKIKTYRKAKEI
jgi:hypothetical protein